MFKKLLLAGAFAVSATAGLSASCSPGTCNVAISAQGLDLGLGTLLWDFDDAVNGGGGSFTFTSDFNNNTAETVGQAEVSVQDFLTSAVSTSAVIKNLMLSINGDTFAITDATGASINGDDPVAVRIGLVAGSNTFTLTGDAVDSTTVPSNSPDVTITIAAVPVPAAALLLGTALAGFGVASRRRKKA